MKRGSIVAPIILILVGALFLASNLRPDIPMLEFLGRYWPFLLIGWGFVRLVEIVIWAARGKPLPASGVSGGEWVLVVFLSLIGSGLYAFHTTVGWPPTKIRMRGIEVFGEAFDYSIEEKRTPAAKSTRLILENLRGHARITGADVTEVRVSGRKTVRSLSREAADEVNRTTVLDVETQGDSILVRTNQNRVREERYVTADLEITVPRGMSVQARGRDGDFDVNDLQGAVEIDSDRAGIRLQNIGGNVKINVRRSDLVRGHTLKGDVDLQGRGNDIELESVEGQVMVDGSWSGDLQFRHLAKPLRYQGTQAEMQVERVNGEVRLGRGHMNGESLAGPVILRGRNKGCCDVELSDFTNSLDLTLDRGDIDLRPAVPTPKVRVELGNGNIHLAMPKEAKFSLRANVEKGEIENDYGPPLRLDDERRGASLSGSVGEGAEISIVSERGTITVRKAEEAPPRSPLTPQPPRLPRLPATELD